MAKTEDYDLIGSYNNQRILPMDAERTINMFEYIDPLCKKPKMLVPTSGLDSTNVSFGALTGVGFRASFFFNDVTYHVIGDEVWQVKQVGSSLVPSHLNPDLPLTTSTGYVGVDANTFQIIFVDGVHGYIYDTTLLQFLQITDFSFPTTPIDVCNLDGYFVVANGGTNQFQLSSFNQGMNWGPSANLFKTDFVTNNTYFKIGASTISGPAGTQNYATGTPVTFVKGTGTLPTTFPSNIADPANQGVTYYAIQVVSGGVIDPLNIQIATSLANAEAGIALTISADSVDPVTIVSNAQLQLGTITAHPGNIVACRTLHRRLFLFSSFFTEVWENAGAGTTLPFRRNNSLLMEFGTPAIGSISVSFDMMNFLSQTRDGLGPVMQVNGAQPIPVSNKALDFQLAQYAANGQISDCRAFFMRENGILFYRMNFTLANHTFVYNSTQSDPSQEATRLWHEEQLLDGSRHPSQTHVYYNGVNYVGHFSKPILYEMDSDVFTNDGEHIERMRIGKPFFPPGAQRIRADRFQLDLLQGSTQSLIFDEVDILTENSLPILAENGDELITSQTFPINQDIHPVVFLSISKDGGQTYGNELTAPMGLSGERTFRTLWRKIGTTKRGQAFVPRIKFFHDIPFFVLGASWTYEVLPE